MKRHGFTLAELVIVIALSSVVLLAITAMMLSISGYSHARSAELEAKSEISMLEARLGAWFTGFDSVVTEAPIADENTLSFRVAGSDGESGKTVSAVFNPKTGVLTLGKADGESETLSSAHLSDVSFSKSTEADADPGLVRCTVTYRVDEKTRTYTFLLLKRSENAQ